MLLAGYGRRGDRFQSPVESRLYCKYGSPVPDIHPILPDLCTYGAAHKARALPIVQGLVFEFIWDHLKISKYPYPWPGYGKPVNKVNVT